MKNEFLCALNNLHDLFSKNLFDYDYIFKNKLMPFYKSCCDKAKHSHLERFFRAIGPVIINVGFSEGEERRAQRLAKKKTKWFSFNFPMLGFSREQCEKILRAHKVEARKTGCWFCPKQPNPPEWAIKNIINHPGKRYEAMINNKR